MKPLIGLQFQTILFVLAAALIDSPARAQDASVDRLIHKLPPPESIARSVAQQADPALSDPLAKEMIAAAKAQNFGNALSLSRRLAERYPKSAGAQFVHGGFALGLRRFPEASAAYRKAISIQPKLAAAYLGLGVAEAWQNHFAAAMSNYQQVTRLDPQAEIGWLALSTCAAKLGRLRDSLEYAKRATAVAPSSWVAWNQLAQVERINGNNQAALNAMARSDKLRRAGARKTQRTR